MPADPLSKEFQDKASTKFDEMLLRAEKHRESFGAVMPVMHAEAWGERIVGVGSAVYKIPRDATFQEFLAGYLRGLLGPDWWKSEAEKHPLARHPIAQWQTSAESQMTEEIRQRGGRASIIKDGAVAAFLSLAYDFHVIEQNTPFRDGVLNRLKSRDGFAGVRYELFVAAIFARAMFSIEPQDETDGSQRHPEFVATHRTTGFRIAVEAKARNRRATDMTPERAQVYDLIENAAKKASPATPLALFVDVAMPPAADPDLPPAWLAEVDEDVRIVAAKAGGQPGPFDLVMFTNVPYRYAPSGVPAKVVKSYLVWQPTACRVPPDVTRALIASVEQSGNIPEFEAAAPAAGRV